MPREIHYSQANTAQSTSGTAYLEAASLSFTPEASATYFVLACWQGACSSTTQSHKTRFVRGGDTYSDLTVTPISPTDYFCFGQSAILVAGGSPSIETYRVQFASSGGGATSSVKNIRLLAIKKGAADQSTESTSLATTGSTSWQDGASLSFTPGSSGDYLILASADMSFDSGVLAGVRLNVSGTTRAETNLDQQGNGQRFAWSHAVRVTLAASSQTIKLQYRTVNSGTTGIQQQRIIAVRLDDGFEGNHYAENVATTSTNSTSFVNKTTLTETPEEAGHIVFASAIGQANTQNTHSTLIQLLDGDDSTVKADFLFRSRQPFNIQASPFFTFYRAILSASSKSWRTNYASSGGNAVEIHSSSIAALQYEQEAELMGLVDMGFMEYPPSPPATATTSMQIDASGEKAAFVCTVPKTGSIAAVRFRLGTVTTGQTLKLSLQNVAANGDPDETIDQSGTVAVADADDNAWKLVTLDSARSVTVGDWLAVVIEFDSTVGNLTITCLNAMVLSNVYTVHKTSGSWAKSNARAPIVFFEYSDGSYSPMQGVRGIQTAVVYASNSTPDEVGNKITMPIEAVCLGLYFAGSLSGDMDLVLYGTDGSTVLASASLDTDAKGTSTGVHVALFSSPVTLAANSTYRITAKPTTTTSISRFDMQAPTSNAIAQFPSGSLIIKTQRTDSGTWTDTDTERCGIGLLLQKVHDGSPTGGGGGGSMIGARIFTGM